MKNEEIVKLNVNAWCQVKLTKYGLEIINKSCPAVLESSFKFNEKTNEYKDELWSLMNIFGEHMWMGNRNTPFENNEIKIIQRN